MKTGLKLPVIYFKLWPFVKRLKLLIIEQLQCLTGRVIVRQLHNGSTWDPGGIVYDDFGLNARRTPSALAYRALMAGTLATLSW